MEILDSLTPNQKAQLLLDPQGDASENATFVREVIESIADSPDEDEDELLEFFEAFSNILEQVKSFHAHLMIRYI